MKTILTTLCFIALCIPAVAQRQNQPPIPSESGQTPAPSTPGFHPEASAKERGTPPSQERRTDVEVFLLFTKEGQLCRVTIFPCENHIRHNFNFAERLVPPVERGAFLKTLKRTVGDCTDMTVLEYENVIVSENYNACYSRWVDIAWKERECAPANPNVSRDVCGIRAASLRAEQQELVSDIETTIASYEQQALQQKDETLKKQLMKTASLMRGILRANGFKPKQSTQK